MCYPGSPGSKTQSEPPSGPGRQLVEARERFIIAIFGEEPPAERQIQTACSWYIEFLEFKIKQSWNPLLLPVVKNIGTCSSDEDLSVAFHLLEIIALEFNRVNLALIDILDKLYNDELLKETDDDRSHANQLVFAAFGWMSIFPLPVRHKQELRANFGQLSRCAVLCRTKSGTTTTANYQSLGTRHSYRKEAKTAKTSLAKAEDFQKL